MCKRLTSIKKIKESDYFLSGKQIALTRVKDFNLGMSICYDLRFPELYRHYFGRGAEILTVPSAFTAKTGQAHWESLLRARAIENLAYVLAPNQVGTDSKGILSHGHSMIVSPWGEIIARASNDKEEIIYGVISHDNISKARAILPGIRF